MKRMTRAQMKQRAADVAIDVQACTCTCQDCLCGSCMSCSAHTPGYAFGCKRYEPIEPERNGPRAVGIIGPPNSFKDPGAASRERGQQQEIEQQIQWAKLQARRNPVSRKWGF
jgi:hypothetical protein